MSLPFYEITCTQCNYNQILSNGTNYQYDGELFKEPVLSYGFCYNCDELVKILMPYIKGDAIYRIKELQELINEYENSYISKLSSTKKDRAIKGRAELKIIEQRIQNFQNNGFPPRCIECSSKKVNEVRLPYGEYDKRTFLNVKHTCGGELIADMKGRFNFSKTPHVKYNNKGKITFDERLPKKSANQKAKSEKEHIINCLSEQAIGIQAIVNRFLVEVIKIDANQIQKIELAYFSLTILLDTALRRVAKSDLENILDSTSLIVIKKSLSQSGANYSLKEAVATYQKRFNEYQILIKLCYGEKESSSGNPFATLLMHLVEQVTRQSAAHSMIEIVAASGFIVEIFEDEIEFIREIFEVT